jgi:membrane peptidoglycan carboxypeptidase
LATGELDGNGKDEVILDLGASGLWIRVNNASWTKLHAASPTHIAVGDIDGNNQDDMQVGKPIAGKTGTTNDEKDAWFVGFSPDLVVGVFIGYDKPRPMGKGQTGGVIAAPIFTEFMKVALKDAPPKEFQVPAGLELIPIDRRTGLRAQGEGGDVILEAFKPGTAPSSDHSIIGYEYTMGAPALAPSSSDPIFRYDDMMDGPTQVSRWQYRKPYPSGLPKFAPWEEARDADSQAPAEDGGRGYRTLPNGVIIKVR